VDTTQPEQNTGPVTLESAAELLVQQEPEELPETEEVDEAEEANPVEDADVEAEEVDEDEGEEESPEEDSDDEDEYEDEDEADEAEAPQTFTVKVDGKEETVTLEDLKRGYSGQKYVQKGMQQAAEARKQAEEAYTQLMQERQSLASLVQQAQQGGLQPPVEPSRELFDQDPIGYMEEKLKYDEKVKEYQQQMGQVQAQMQQQTQAEAQARAAMAQQEAQKLVEIVPELKDAKKAQKFKDKLVKTATEVYGYSQDEIASLTSHRDFLVLRDAMAYRDLQAGKEVVKEKSKKARPAIKAGTKKVNTKGDARRKHRERLKKSGSVEDALNLILNN